MYSPDGKSLVYLARISGSQKLFRLDLDSGKKTQLTFGTQDEAAAKFLDADTLIFSSTATDPATPLTPDVARNGNIFNLWSLSLKTGELRQYTDALGGVLSPVVLSRTAPTPTARVRRLLQGQLQPAHLRPEGAAAHRRVRRLRLARTDRRLPGAAAAHARRREQVEEGPFDKMFLDGRPPVNVGVTSGGDVFGGSMVSFTDVLGDQQFSMYASSVQQYKTMSFSYLNLSRRFQWARAGLFADAVLLRAAARALLYDPAIAPFISREDALATQTVRGGSIFGIYPFSTYRRVEFSGGLVDFREEYAEPRAPVRGRRVSSRRTSATSCSSTTA